MKRATALLAATTALTWGLLVGCSDQPAGQEAPVPPTPGGTNQSIAYAQQSAAPPLAGRQVTVPKLHITNAALVPLGLNGDRTLQVPPLSAPQELGVYDRLSWWNGKHGPLVIAGHVNSGGVDGAFAHLDTLQAGDEVDVVGPDGTAKFRVYKAQVIAKGAFPTKDVYSDTPTPELRLITCGPGPLDSTGHNYLNQTIVWAKKV
jgi:LPXTG-site transpeptidase (sortase) family protein